MCSGELVNLVAAERADREAQIAAEKANREAVEAALTAQIAAERADREAQIANREAVEAALRAHNGQLHANEFNINNPKHVLIRT